MTMLDRLARAIIGVNGVVMDASVEDAMPVVQAILHELLTPTEGMVAGFAKVVSDRQPFENYAEYATAAFQAAIQAAIEGK